MANPLALLDHAVSQPQRQILYGHVSTAQPAPTSFGSPLYVVLPGWTPDFYLTVTNWPACHGAALPAAGADVLLVKDDTGNLRCAWWSGAYSDARAILLDPPSGDSTGVTDGAKLAAAVAALPASGGIIQAHPGSYYFAAGLNCDDKTGVHFQGTGGASSGASAGTRFTYTGASGPAVSAKSTGGFTSRGIQWLYSNASLSGFLFDFQHSAIGGDSNNILFAESGLGGAGIRNAGVTLVNLDKAIIATFRDTDFYNAAYAVQGRSVVGNYSNVVKFEGNCTFTGFLNAPILNPGEAWTFVGATFEGLSNGNAGAIASTFGGVTALTVLGGWFGDANAMATWIDLPLGGALIAGNYISTGNLGVNLHAGSTGCAVIGNQFDTVTSAIACSSGDQMLLVPNSYNNVTSKVVLTSTIPTNSIYLTADGISVNSLFELAGTLRNINSANEATSATAGAATGLPATPAGYLTIQDQSGTSRKVPYYNP